MAQQFHPLLAMPKAPETSFNKPPQNGPALSAIDCLCLLDQFGLKELQYVLISVKEQY